MNEFQVTGTILHIYDEEAVSEKFTKREFIVETPGRYPQKVVLQFSQDNCSKLDSYQAGDEVVVSFDIRSFEWKDKGTGKKRVGNNHAAWKIELQGGEKKRQPVAAGQAEVMMEDDLDDLPF